jgi:dihydrofolate reductase
MPLPSTPGVQPDAIPKVVFSRTLEHTDWRNSRICRDAQAEVARLRGEDGKDVYVFGSADLSVSLMQAGLFDEIRIGVNPIPLGSGNPLFKPLPSSVSVKLLEARPLNSGCVILRYATQGASA